MGDGQGRLPPAGEGPGALGQWGATRRASGSDGGTGWLERASLECVAGAQGSGRVLGGGRAGHAQPAAACPSQDKLAERKALLLQAVQR